MNSISITLDIAKTMHKVLPELNKGLDGLGFHLKPECIDEWNENYAIVDGLYYDEIDSDYFDSAQFEYDFEQKVKKFFPGCEINFYWTAQELEIWKK